MTAPDWKLRAELPALARWNDLDVALETIRPRCEQQAVSAIGGENSPATMPSGAPAC